MKPLIIIFITAVLAAHGRYSVGQVPVAPPHRGIVQKSGDFHIELVRGINRYIFYVLDKQNKPLSMKGATGIVAIHYSDSTSFVSHLSAFGEYGLSVPIGRADAALSLAVGIKVNDKSLAAIYKHVPGVIRVHRHAYRYGDENYHR